MITKVIIKDKTKTPVPYLSDLKVLDNGTEFNFKAGVNIIVGPNGSGKSTLLKLIERYSLIDKDTQDIQSLKELFSKNKKIEDHNEYILDGVDVYSDYKYTSFRFVHLDELTKGGSDRWMSSYENFAAAYQSMNSSTGESVKVALTRLFQRMFSSKTNLKFPIEELKDQEENGNSVWSQYAKEYLKYIKSHAIPYDVKTTEFTVIMDEPDRNLDIFNIDEIYPVLANRKEQTQIIAVIHNPFLIYKLTKCEGINWIEMEDGYIDKITNAIDNLIK